MLNLRSDLVEAMFQQAKQDYPIEACGLIAGCIGSNRPTRLIRMCNAAQSATEFYFDSSEQLQVWKTMEARGEEPLVIYHSHTKSSAYPSWEDVEYATEPNMHYVIISNDPHCQPALRSFRIQKGIIVEEAIKVLNFANTPAQTSTPITSSSCIKELP